MILGESKRWPKAAPRRVRNWKPRTVTIEGVDYEVVFDGHRDGPTLLAYDDARGANYTIERGGLTAASLPRFSFLG